VTRAPIHAHYAPCPLRSLLSPPPWCGARLPFPRGGGNASAAVSRSSPGFHARRDQRPPSRSSRTRLILNLGRIVSVGPADIVPARERRQHLAGSPNYARKRLITLERPAGALGWVGSCTSAWSWRRLQIDGRRRSGAFRRPVPSLRPPAPVMYAEKGEQAPFSLSRTKAFGGRACPRVSREGRLQRRLGAAPRAKTALVEARPASRSAGCCSTSGLPGQGRISTSCREIPCPFRACRS